MEEVKSTSSMRVVLLAWKSFTSMGVRGNFHRSWKGKRPPTLELPQPYIIVGGSYRKLPREPTDLHYFHQLPRTSIIYTCGAKAEDIFYFHGSCFTLLSSKEWLIPWRRFYFQGSIYIYIYMLPLPWNLYFLPWNVSCFLTNIFAPMLPGIRVTGRPLATPAES